ncbi:MAG: 23S rRNA (adenine(2503)-C(2))-methyltransferase RlmN [Cloacibacillus sp.]
MAEKRYALDMNCDEWKEYLEKGLQEPKFRADQICQWLWQKHTDDTEGMTNLSKELRAKLDEKVNVHYPSIVREQRSSDGTRKFLLQLADGNSVESVLMKYGERLTACISTQVGCPLQCTFCATGLSGFVRNLTAGEIAGQVLAIEKRAGREVNNVVYMGMGEPFMNTDAVLKSVRMLNDPKMRNLGIRHITISTSGVIPGIKALAQSGLGVRLAVSLHAADDELRSFLMPVNQSYPVDQLRTAMQEYQDATGDRISIEYTLFGGVNDSLDHARALVRYLKGIHSFVNLIPYNSVDGRYEKPKSEDVLKFRSVLQTAGFETEIRSEQGADIDAACGQLRRKTIEGDSAPFDEPAYSLTKTDMAPEKRREEPPVLPAKAKSTPRRADTGANSKRYPTRATGGFVAERGKRRKEDKPSQERYRSGKMKEARPAYKGQQTDEAQPFEARAERGFGANRTVRPAAQREERFIEGGREQRPQRAEGARPYRGNDGRPQRAEGARPYRSNDGRPQRQDGARPYRSNDDRPQRADGARPYRNNDDRPQRQDGAKPYRSNDDRSQRQDGARPYRSNDDRPQRQDGAKPYRAGDKPAYGKKFGAPRNEERSFGERGGSKPQRADERPASGKKFGKQGAPGKPSGAGRPAKGHSGAKPSAFGKFYGSDKRGNKKGK